jgi:hypothetical protein
MSPIPAKKKMAPRTPEKIIDLMLFDPPPLLTKVIPA